MATALAKQHENGGAVAPSRSYSMASVIAEQAEQRKLLGEYVKKQMVEGTDYGVIPGTAKPTLLKPGAEKLTSLFRCVAKFDVAQQIEDWDRPLFHYSFKCSIVSLDTGEVIAEGVGSANSREGRYRWRNGERRCPDCGKATIIKGKAEYGGGYICFAKKGGCGAKFDDHDESITGQEIGRVENDDVCTLVNTIMKMAKKRALVDGAIALARCSDLFTQDVEDIGEDHDLPRQAAKQSPPPSQGGWPRGGRQEPPPVCDLEHCLKLLADCKTLQQLQDAWTGREMFDHRQVYPENREILTRVKDERKSALQAAEQKPSAPVAPQQEYPASASQHQQILEEFKRIGMGERDVASFLKVYGVRNLDRITDAVACKLIGELIAMEPFRQPGDEPTDDQIPF